MQFSILYKCIKGKKTLTINSIKRTQQTTIIRSMKGEKRKSEK